MKLLSPLAIGTVLAIAINQFLFYRGIHLGWLEVIVISCLCIGTSELVGRIR